VHQRATEHPGHDLHVLVRVGVEPGARLDDVVVVHQQHAVVGVGLVEVAAERERVLGVQPVDLGGETVVRSADVDLRVVHAASCGCLLRKTVTCQSLLRKITLREIIPSELLSLQ
jgi:hypothetical protein